MELLVSFYDGSSADTLKYRFSALLRTGAPSNIILDIHAHGKNVVKEPWGGRRMEKTGPVFHQFPVQVHISHRKLPLHGKELV